MKMKYVVIILVVLLILGLLIFILCNKKEKEKIESISSLSFFYTNGYAINTDTRYEIDCKDKCIAIIKQYGKSEEETVEVEIDSNTMNKIIDLLNKYDVIKWDGFSKSDHGVLDGDSFSMHFTYNDEKRVSASGYMMWPKNYREVEDGLNEIFNSLMEE